MSPALPAFTHHFSALAPHYDVILSDVWGVVHNGVAAFTEAGDALSRFRAGGGTVVLITNAPRPGNIVAGQIAEFGVPREAYDAIVSSGDVTRNVILGHRGEAILHIGPERDHSIFDEFNVRLTSVDEADYAVCSGLEDDDGTPEDYRAVLVKMRERGMFMVCANPDVVVERGEQLIYCAGAVADLYGELGGEVLYAGKPYRPIYQQALAAAEAARGKPTPLDRVLAIGDSVRTDLTGASRLGIDCLFVTAGIHAEELGARDNPDPEALAQIFNAGGHMPKAVTRRLMW